FGHPCRRADSGDASDRRIPQIPAAGRRHRPGDKCSLPGWQAHQPGIARTAHEGPRVMPETVDLVLDLQNANRQPDTASDFLNLWEALEGRLHGASLQGSASWQVDIPTWGTCGLLLADPAAAPRVVTEETPFVVRSVLEPSRVFYKCATCLAGGRE